MSGGTSFLAKGAKSVKSEEKFHPELENKVDMKKVKLDVMKPWIAQRVTELRKLEEEVIIEVIWGLLDGKVVDWETLQDSIGLFLGETGTIMEERWTHLVSELWTHLVSAQENASGIPQQFLDAEEGTRKKQEDTDRIIRELEDTEVTDEKNGSKETARSDAPLRYQFPSPKPSLSPPRVKRTFRSPGDFIIPFTRSRSPRRTSPRRRSPSPDRSSGSLERRSSKRRR